MSSSLSFFSSNSKHIPPCQEAIQLDKKEQDTVLIREAQMALKTIHHPSSLLKPPNCCSSPSAYTCKVAAKNRQNQASALKCRAILEPRQEYDDEPELPLVLHPAVVFPGATLLLQLFEFRHRMMMHSLLQEGLVRFGVVCSSCRGSGTADVGCVVQAVEHVRLVGDRFFLTCAAGDRFEVADVVRTKPYVTARIKTVNDRPGMKQHGLHCLAQEVEEHLKNVTRLSDRMNGRRRRGRRTLRVRGPQSPASLSFAVARLFDDDLAEQQALLRLEDTAERLAREREYLVRRWKYLAAVAAVTDALEHLCCDEK